MSSERDVYTQLIENQESQEKLTSRTFKWSATILPFLFPALAGSLYGYDIGATSGASISIVSSSLSGTDWYNLSSVETGLVESGSLYGALVGSVLAFTVADFLGRRRELMAAAACYIIGALIEAVALNFALLVVGRLIFRFGIGLAMHGAPMYIAETCPVEIRGTLVSLKEAFIVLGMLLGYLVGYLAIGAVGGWRIMYGVAAPIALIMGVGMWWLPPSPRWLLLCACKGKGAMDVAEERAAAAIRRLRGKDIDEHIISYQLQETRQSLQLVREEANLSEIFKGASLKALVLGCGLVLFQQITGQPSVLYYASSIFQSAGFSAASDATRVSVILGGFKVIMTLIAVWKVDKLGRRPLLIAGVSLLVLALFLLALYYAFIQGASALAVVALLLYVGAYQVSFGPIVWLMISEIFPLRTRGRALSITVLLNFAANALVTFSFSPLKAAIGTAATFLVFGIIGVISLIFIIFKVPETKGLSLEEIEANFSE
ncbi:hypothetical protein L7F22_010507 [Adiantum nelumboides]|nr:hypothetical protein [Adiantum nelumboides]